MKDFVIGLDVDGVVADLVNCFLALNNFYYEVDRKNFPKKYIESDIVSYRMEEILGVYTCSELWHHAFEHSLVEELSPYEGAIEGIEKLRELGRVVFVTSPSYSYVNWSQERFNWLKNNVRRFNEKDLVSLGDKTLFNGDMLIDDASHNLQQWTTIIKKPSIKVLRPWNANYYCDYVAESWDDIVILTKEIVESR